MAWYLVRGSLFPPRDCKEEELKTEPTTQYTVYVLTLRKLFTRCKISQFRRSVSMYTSGFIVRI